MDERTVPGFSGRPAIAVLPFTNTSEDPGQEYFAHGIAEGLIKRLSRRTHFPVIARNSSFIYKGPAVDIKQVSRELGVRYVVQGEARREGEEVRIAAQILDDDSEAELWAAQFDRRLGDIFSVKDEISEAIVASAYPGVKQLERGPVEHSAPQSLEAWDCSQQGWWQINLFTRDGNETARDLFKQGIALDPLSAEAFAGLAFTYDHDIFYRWTESLLESVAELDRAAQKAVLLDSEEPLGFIALGMACRVIGQHGRMVDALQRASRLSPSLPAPYRLLGTYLPLAGRVEEGIEHLKKGMRLNPRDPFMHESLVGMALAHTAAGRYDEAVQWAQRALQTRPDWPIPHLVLAGSYAQLERSAEAQAAVEELSRLSPAFSLSELKIFLSAAAPEYVERASKSLGMAGLKE
jgi:TolB-like protein